MKQILAASLVFTGIIAGCAPITNTPDLHATTIDAAQPFKNTITRAGTMGAAYLENAGNSANTAQLVELPILGSAIAAASFLAFNAHPDAALVSAIVGGTAGSLSSYYQPRKAAGIYADGAVATYCVRNVAVQARQSFDYVEQAGGLPLLKPSGTNEFGVATKLDHALDDIALTIFKRLLSETEPDIPAILAKIKTDIAVGDAGTAGARGAPQARGGIGPDDPQVQFLIRIDEQITQCKVKVGTS